MNLDDLKAKGFVKNADGSWSKPGAAVPVCTVEAHCPKQASIRPLDSDSPKLKRSKEGVAVCRVRLSTFRKRLLDKDAISYCCKSLTDIIADSLGVDDADSRVEWEWSQVETRGVEGVVVTIEQVNL